MSAYQIRLLAAMCSIAVWGCIVTAFVWIL
jgi:hypothetical protein